MRSWNAFLLMDPTVQQYPENSPSNSWRRAWSKLKENFLGTAELRSSAASPKFNAADVILWRHQNLTGGILVVTLAVWLVFEKSGYTLISLVSSVFLLLLTILFLWAKSAAILNRHAPPLPHLHLSEEMVNVAAATIRNHINMLLSISQDIALGKDSRMFFKVAAFLLLISVIGGLTDFLSLGYISLVILLTVPAIYERYEGKIDRYAILGYKRLRMLYDRLDTECISRIQSLILGKKKA